MKPFLTNILFILTLVHYSSLQRWFVCRYHPYDSKKGMILHHNDRVNLKNTGFFKKDLNGS